MEIVEPAVALADGQVVARFRTTPVELRDVILHFSKKLFTPTRVISKRRKLFSSFMVWVAVGFIIAVIANLRQLSWLPIVLQVTMVLVLAFVLLSLFGRFIIFRRNRKILTLLQNSFEFEDVAVACHKKGLSLVTASQVSFVDFRSIEQLSMFGDICVIRYRLSFFYIPERGFLSLDDRNFFITQLNSNIAANIMTEFNAAQG
jgi:hypothetical protein